MRSSRRFVVLLASLGAALASANGRPDCLRNCVTAQKAFEKQCKETAQNDPESKAGCEMVLKRLQATCAQNCQRGEKMKKPANTNTF